MELTPQEKKIKDLKSCGWNNKAIAEELNIGVQVVEAIVEPVNIKPKKVKSEDKKDNG